MKKFIILVSLLSFLFLSHQGFAESEIEQYKITAGDRLNITVYQEPDLSGIFEVKEDGTITYPLLGRVKVESLTKLQIEKEMTTLLEKDYLVDPGVRVNIESYSKYQVLLLGHVTNPGTYDFPATGNLTLLELITEAGGFTAYAAINGTKIVRTKEGDRKVVINPQVNEIIKGRREDVKLEPGDLVIVPERLF